MNDQLKHGNGSESSGYDRHDVNVRFVAVVTIAVIIFLLVSVFVLYQYFGYEKEQEIYEKTLRPESEKLVALRARETSLLGSYGISDTTTGAFRIPIDSAIELIVAEAGHDSTAAGGDR